MNAFFDQMEVIERILWFIAIPFSFALLIQTLLTLIGVGGDETDADTDLEIDDTDDVIGFKIFTVRNFIAFFTFFSWTGIGMLRGGSSTFVSIIVGVSAGLVAVLITMSLFMAIIKMTEKGNLNYENALFSEGICYLTIPSNMQGKGKVTIKVQSRQVVIDAMTKSSEPIQTGEVVFVSSVEGNILIVKKKGET